MALHVTLCTIAVGMNLFVMKQINLCGLDVTATDSLAVAYILGLNLFQEYYGKKQARFHVFISFMICGLFCLMSILHLSYTPNSYDLMNGHYVAILSNMPRIIITSICSFILVQFLDIAFFQYLRERMEKKWLILRTTISLILSQGLDTLIFTFFALYGLVGNIWHIMIVSLAIKLIVIGLCVPITHLSKKMVKPCA